MGNNINYDYIQAIAKQESALSANVNGRKHLSCVALGGRVPINLNGGSGNSNLTATESQKLCNAAGRGGNIGGIRPMLVNWRLDSSTIIAADNSMRIGASMLNPLTGAAIPYTFRGELFPLVGKNALMIADQGFDMDVTAGEQFLIRCGAQVSTSGYTMVGGNNPASVTYDLSRSHTDVIAPANEAADSGGRFHSNGSMGVGYTPTNGVNASFPYTPACILGFSEKPQPSVFVIGDSNAYGTGDAGNGDGQGAVGYIERGLRTTAKGVTAGTLWVRSGGALNLYNSTTTAQLFGAAQYHTHFLQQLSGNSVSGGLTLAQMQQRTIIGWKAAKLRGLKVIQLESLPRTTSDNSAVISGWEVGGLRDQFNTWCKSVVGKRIDANGNIDNNSEIYLDEYWEINDLVQNPVNNLWIASSLTSDGIHLSATGHALVATRIAALANNLTV
jgi:lysophospholipase L1-like esterase